MSSWLGRTCRLTSLLALACGRPASEPLPRQVPPREVPASTPVPSPSSALPAGVLSRELSHEDVLWDVFELDLTKVELRLYGQADPTLRRFAAVRARLETEGARWGPLTNAGLFHRGERPVGLFIEGGRAYAPLTLEDGEGNFFLKPNGVFYVDGQGAHVVVSEAYVPTAGVSLATQSGPLLVRHHALHPRFLEGSTSRTTRSGIGVRDAQHVVIAVSRAPVTFYATATLFRDRLDCGDALYLDGTISDFDVPGREDASQQAFGGVLAVVARKPR